MENKQKNKNMSCRSTAHCFVLPFPSQPSIVPMLQFCKRLKDKGLTITLIFPRSFYKTLHKSSSIPFPIETISDGYDIPWIGEYRGLSAYLTKFHQVGSQTLTQLLLKKRNKKVSPVDCIIYSSVFPWALDVAKKFGLVGAAFFSFSSAVECIYYNVQQGLLRVPLKRGSCKVLVEGLPVMEYRDLPSHISEFRCNLHDRFNMFVNQFSNIGAADWLFCNTFYALEKEVVVMMQKQKIGRFRPIGPHIPSRYLDKRMKYDKGYNQLRTLKPGSHAWIKWLKEKPDDSVVYISSEWQWSDQITELAWGIKGSNKNFLWEVEESKQHMIPDKFLQETSKKQGLIVSWCPQVEVLAQTSVGCFVTDCGWNSVLEAKSLGVPMVAMPRWNDQRTNAKYITDVWKTGVQAKSADGWTRIVRRDVVEGCIREVMQGKMAGEMKRNAERWRELARKAVDEGGSSDRNIDEFVASLTHS